MRVASKVEVIIDPCHIAELERELDRDALVELLDLFVGNTAARVARLNAGNLDRGAIRSLAHSVKGAAAMVGAPELTALSATLEQEALTTSDDRIEERIGQLTQLFEAVRAHLVAQYLS